MVAENDATTPYDADLEQTAAGMIAEYRFDGQDPLRRYFGRYLQVGCPLISILTRLNHGYWPRMTARRKNFPM